MASAMLSLFSLLLMAMGGICITMALSKEIVFFLKPASVCFVLSGNHSTKWCICLRVAVRAASCVTPCPPPPPQAYWCCCPCWSSSSQCGPSWPATTLCRCTTTSPGPCHVWAAPAPSRLWAGCSSCCWRCPTAPGRGVTALPASGREARLHSVLPPWRCRHTVLGKAQLFGILPVLLHSLSSLVRQFSSLVKEQQRFLDSSNTAFGLIEYNYPLLENYPADCILVN